MCSSKESERQSDKPCSPFLYTYAATVRLIQVDWIVRKFSPKWTMGAEWWSHFSCLGATRISTMMMAPLELLLEAYSPLVACVAFVVGRIRLVWKWLLRLVLHWALEVVRCCSLMFLPSFRYHLLLFGFDPAKLCCRRHLGSSQGTMDNSPSSRSLLPDQRGRSTVGRCKNDAPRR